MHQTPEHSITHSTTDGQSSPSVIYMWAILCGPGPLDFHVHTGQFALLMRQSVGNDWELREGQWDYEGGREDEEDSMMHKGEGWEWKRGVAYPPVPQTSPASDALKDASTMGDSTEALGDKRQP